MGKKFSTPVSLLTMLLLSLVAITCSIASEGHLMGDMDIYAAKLKLDQPFNVMILARIGQQTVPASLDVSFSAGVQLLKGEKHWQGIVDSTLDKRMDLLFKISVPGTYEISVLEDFIWGNVEPKLVRFPMHRTMFFYVSKDTVLWFSSRDERERAIRDSLVFPNVVLRRARAHADTTYWFKAAQQNISSYTTRADLANLAILLGLLPNRVPYQEIQNHFDSTQTALIKTCQLVYSKPQYGMLDHELSMDMLKRNSKEMVCSLSSERLQALERHIMNHLEDLYDLDQQIIKSKSPGEQTKLLKEREAFLAKEMKERKALLETK